LGTVVEEVSKNGTKTVKIKPQRLTPKILTKETFEQIKSSLKTMKYYTVEYVAQMLGVRPTTVWRLCESLCIKTDKSYESSKKLGDMIDIGLNLISFRTGTIVPELVRYEY
jgi:hypothetical protein